MNLVSSARRRGQDRGAGAIPDAPPQTARARRQRWVINIVMAAIGACFLLPLLWLVVAAFNPDAGPGLSAPHASLANFSSAFSTGAGGAILNSLYLAVVSTVVATGVSILAGYTLSRRHVPFKGSMLLGILFLTGLPVSMLLVPIYEMYVNLNWLNSPFWTSMVLAATSVPFAIWLLKNFIDQVPREFEEAAAIEGSSELRTLWSVVIPLAMPGVAVSAILTFINSWGAFLIPLVLDGNPGNTPGAVGIYQFLDANAQVQYGPLAAYSIIFSVPVLVLYVISSRWLQGGFAFAGGIKG
jgi:multiple sugar transport system permease protein